MTKYIFVTGGVCSSLGKGIASASIGTLLKASGLKVFSMKLDPYLNVDPGTMSPFQHGEVFVTEDGAETDLDLGHYERFIGENLSADSSVTTGKVYMEVLEKERAGKFLGGTIQIIPHITGAIKDRILKAGKHSKADIVLIEIGGTTGDIEGLPYLESIRQLRYELGKENTLYVHLTLLPYLKGSKELKTKPTQASVRDLRSIGIQPDLIIARADYKIPKEMLQKISLFCDVESRAVIPAETLDSIYKVPLEFQKYKVAQIIADKLNLGKLTPKMAKWKQFVDKINKKKNSIKIALVGKYTGLDDAYLSVIESLKIACYYQDRELDLEWISAEELEKKKKSTWDRLKKCKGMVVPGGFGIRGVEGKIMAAKYARETKVPYLGLCLGMQILTIEYARHFLNDPKITSEEFDEEDHSDKSKYIIHFLPGQYKGCKMGGTLRLGAFPCALQKNTKAREHYKKAEVIERHRHRYEVNNEFLPRLAKSDWIASGIYEEAGLVEVAELKSHPFMMGSQFHPEFLSRPDKPHPFFLGLIEAAKARK